MSDTNYKLKKLLKDLEGRRGRHTELISVYIPKGYGLNEITTLLANEISLTQNVKSKAVRNNVTDALTKIQQQLKLYKKNPENGLAIFCGNVSENEGKTDIKIWVVEPPEPIKIKLYWCDQKFETAPLRDMIKEKEVYGLLVMDTKEATFGILRGKSIQVIRHLDSIVPGKAGKGGQCQPLTTNTILSNGDIQQIGNLKINTDLKSADFDNMLITNSPILDVYKARKSLCYKIITKYPRLEVESSKDHFFFVFNNGEIIEKPAEELKIGDVLLMPEKIDVVSEKYEYIDKNVAQILGYFIGDGNYDKNRLVFSESNKQLALYYKKKIEYKFNNYCGFRYRKQKNYYEIKCYGKEIVSFFKERFMNVKKSLSCTIPSNILKSDNEILSSFLRGLFDADGSVSYDRITLSLNNKKLIQQIYLCLLRFGILSSFKEYDNRRNPYTKNHRFTVEITEKKSAQMFKKFIGFSLKRNMLKIDKMIEQTSERSLERQILVDGKRIKEIIVNNKIELKKFRTSGMFLNGKRNMSKHIFEKRILSQINDADLLSKFKSMFNVPILPVVIKEIKIEKKPQQMCDLAVKHQNFIANGVFVHNSQQRYERVRNGLINDFYKQVAESAKALFSEELKGIIIGGPGPSKYDFQDEKHLELIMAKKILGTKDVGYTDEHGLEELVEKSSDILAESAVSKEKELVQRFFRELQKDTGIVSYGIKPVLKALEMGAVSIILISEDLEYSEIEYQCSCGESGKMFVRNDKIKETTCPKCGQSIIPIGMRDIIEAFEERVKEYGSALEIISRSTREGEQLYQLGGIGAILRYKI